MEIDRIITDPLPVKDAAKMLVFLRLLQLIDAVDHNKKLRWRDLCWVKDLYVAHLRAERPSMVVNQQRLEIRCTEKQLDEFFEQELVRKGRVLDLPKPSNGNGNGNGNGKSLGAHPEDLHPEAGGPPSGAPSAQ